MNVSYDPTVKAAARELARRTSIAAASRELGIPARTIGTWLAAGRTVREMSEPRCDRPPGRTYTGRELLDRIWR